MRTSRFRPTLNVDRNSLHDQNNSSLNQGVLEEFVGNRVHFPKSSFFILNVSQIYFGKIVLRMIERATCCQQCELSFTRSKWVRKHFDFISHVQAFKIPKDFGLWQPLAAAHRPHRASTVSGSYDTVYPVAASRAQCFSKFGKIAVRVLFSWHYFD